MPYVVTLPSGRVAPLEPPTLAALLAAGGARLALVSCVWAYPEVDVLSLSEADALFVAGWALDQFCRGEEVADFASVCDHYAAAPSARLGISDRRLAYGFDRGCLLALRAAAAAAEPPVQFNGGGVNG